MRGTREGRTAVSPCQAGGAAPHGLLTAQHLRRAHAEIFGRHDGDRGRGLMDPWLDPVGKSADHSKVCCFSGAMGPIRVDATKIFARAAGGRQVLVYSMRLDAAQDVAMILPVPVPAGAGEDALRFIDLSGREHFFDALDRCWPKILGLSPQRQPQTLVVRTIGSFEASYVPTVADFARLDPRFRLAKGVWQALPMYADWGFVVFRLRAGAQQVHPMAFEFPTRVPDALYFPTVHVHDGRVHRKARFAHTLYFQGPQRIEPLTEVLGHPQPKWRSEWYGYVTGPPRQLPGPQLGREFGEIVDLDLAMVRTYLFGYEPNADVWLAGVPYG